jgi:hypothetical protein
MTTYGSYSTEKQRKAIFALSKKAGLPVPEELDDFSREEASEKIDELAAMVDGPDVDVGQTSRREEQNAQVGKRIRVCLCAKLVYRRLGQQGRDPLEDVEAFKRGVKQLDAVLAELEGGGDPPSSLRDVGSATKGCARGVLESGLAALGEVGAPPAGGGVVWCWFRDQGRAEAETEAVAR